jgi:subtilisin family serine protease
VVIDKKIGGINKAHKKSFFGSFESEYIKDLTEITGDIDSKEYLNKEEFHQILKIKLPKDSKSNVLDVIKKLEKIEGILYASPNYYLYPAVHPNDIRYDGPSLTTGQWALKGTYGIKASNAWDITTGARGINVGILDYGISPHVDLNNNLFPGFNFVDYNSDTNDTENHGTGVAGVVGAVGHNGEGIAGVCLEVSLVPLKIITSGYNNEYKALQSRIIVAISCAMSWNIGILNCSQVPVTNDTQNLTITTCQPLYNAIDNYKGLFVQAAGNEGGNINPNGNIYTRHYYVGLRKRNNVERNNVIIVGAINSSGNRWVHPIDGGSNYGNSTVHLFAPGDGIRSLVQWGGYDTFSGTSFAAPHVAGAAALLKSVYPFLTALEIKNALLNNVTKYSAVSGYCSSGGRLNVQAALNSLGTVVGFMDLKYNKSGVYEKIGRLYLFNNGKWTFVERGFRTEPLNTIPSYPLANSLQMGHVPAAIGNFLGNRKITTPIEVLIPAFSRGMGNHHSAVTVNIEITKNGVTITDGNSIRAFDAESYCHVFKIAKKQGAL